jgi:single-strand selective monofunctional uracil DNA glycosylase
MDLIGISRDLAARVDELTFSAPVACVYNPLDYARAGHEAYLRRFGSSRKEVLLLGMNPGPFGMAQTGVPFGDVVTVRDWLGIDEPVGRPISEHPKRRVLGLACPRVEVSGQRLWCWARGRFGIPESFFARFLVVNYCPLLFLEASGRNLTPDKLAATERAPLLEACDGALREVVRTLAPVWVIGVGRFAHLRAESALMGLDVRIGEILHPSPASPAANRGWAEQAEAQLTTLGIPLPERSR